jgi:hypothetical protein
MELINKFMDEFDELKKKYSIDKVILVNFDDNEMGYHQLSKILDLEEGRFLSMSFSGKNETLCPCCAKNETEFDESCH